MSRLYMGYEETPETGKRSRDKSRAGHSLGWGYSPRLRAVGENEIKSAWSGRVYYHADDYPLWNALLRDVSQHSQRHPTTAMPWRPKLVS